MRDVAGSIRSSDSRALPGYYPTTDKLNWLGLAWPWADSSNFVTRYPKVVVPYLT